MRIYHRGLIFVAVGLTVGFIVGACSPNLPTGTIEKKYYATGPWAVTTLSANGYDLYFPTNLGANGFLHSIITWGNGTGGNSGWSTPVDSPMIPAYRWIWRSSGKFSRQSMNPIF